MPFNGAGQYSFPSNSFNPAVATTIIDPTAWNADVVDLQTALSLCLLADGTQTALNSIPFAAGITVDTIAEFTGGHGVTVAGVNHKTGNIILTDSSDTTKKATFVMSGLTTATTRSWTFPDVSDTFVGLAASQAITGKTYNGLTISTSTGTLTVPNAVTLTGPGVTGTLGYLNVPQNSQIAAYTTVLLDAGKSITHPGTDNNARTFTIDSNANVAYPLGTTITFVNKINTVTIAITSDTLTWAGPGSAGSRTLAANGMATAIKIATTEWFIAGSGLS